MDIKSEFDRALAASQQKDYQAARTILREILKADPRHVDAWVLFAHVAQTREHAIYCLERALFLDNANTSVRQQLERLRAAGEPAPIPAETATPEAPPPGMPEPQPAFNLSGPTGGQALPKKGKMSRVEVILLVILGVLGLTLVCFLGFTVLKDRLSTLFAGKPTPSSDVILEAIYDNVNATNAGDVEWYMSRIHPDSRLYAQTETTITESFANFDLYVEVSGLEIVEQSRTEAQVAFTMVTRKIRGPAFRDNRIQGTFILRLDGDTWKIYDQEIQNIEYLD